MKKLIMNKGEREIELNAGHDMRTTHTTKPLQIYF